MSRNTLESNISAYNTSDEYYDSYGKFFLYGDTKGEMKDALRIYNKGAMLWDLNRCSLCEGPQKQH